MIDEAKRDEVVALAKSWLRTPYHNKANIKGVGVDCVWYLYEVYKDAGLCEVFQIPDYHPQFFLHQGEEIYLNQIRKRCTEIKREQVQKADIAMYKIGRVYAHGAIIISPTNMIHAFKEAKCVMESNITAGRLAACKPLFFTPGR